ncbi:hypothetical protein [Pedobacter sp. SYSU D00535]|uniref:hypothetical protein n=1 Tax=Pedobacter sp. SYSU D00535 TaxID=2810308 RepID=UPI001A95CF19|nr:hypothetical protein [Pedobacter sp. SYSU D00535]
MSSKLSCFKSSLESLKGQEIYSEIQTAAFKVIPSLKNADNRSVIADTSFIKKWKIDDAVFLNSKRDKCLLLLLEQTSSDMKLDRIEIIQGTLINIAWCFSFGRLPEIPEITYTVTKEIKDGKNLNNSFDALSEKGRAFVLSAGTIKTTGCFLDDNYWFNNEKGSL